jgi:fructokinase
VIASLGEALIDFTPVLESGHLAGFRLHPGGSPYNVSVGVARLGAPAAFAGRVSEDLFGGVLMENLAAGGVETGLVSRAAEPSGLAFAVPSLGDVSYDLRVAGTSAATLRPEHLEAAAFAGVTILHFGSLGVALEPSRQAVLGLIRALSGRVLLSFDPNVRTRAVAGWDAYLKAVDECMELADIVKLSDQDSRLLGRQASSSSAPVVVTTRGPDGSEVSFGTDRELRLHCPAAPATVVDAVGAGDAYTAGLLVALFERGAVTRERLAALDVAGWREVLRFAHMVAALTCERPGADPPRREEVEQRLAGGSIDS